MNTRYLYSQGLSTQDASICFYMMLTDVDNLVQWQMGKLAIAITQQTVGKYIWKLTLGKSFYLALQAWKLNEKTHLPVQYAFR